MADTLVATPKVSEARANIASPERTTIPWYIWCLVAAVTSDVIGLHWDISWHRTIGRDEFWTPAHLAIYLCGVLAGISCGYLILSTTFGSRPEVRNASVKVLGFRGPLGAFVSAWGGITMLTSAPFDDWWHNAYGLDVEIISPPHVVLAVGTFAVSLGALILIQGYLARTAGKTRERLYWLSFYVGGLLLIQLMILAATPTWRIFMHSARFYRWVALMVPFALVFAQTAWRRRWAATAVSVVYMAVWIAFLWILPLFPGEPKLGPVYQPVTHFIPLGFPLLLVGPALALDLLLPRIAAWKPWRRSLLAGSVFLAIVVALQWPFGDFLLSPGSQNWVFGSHYFDYSDPPTSYTVRQMFLLVEKTPAQFWAGMGIALATSIVMTRLGLAGGAWMQRIRR